MKKEQTQSKLKKFELSQLEQQKSKGGYAPVGIGDFIQIRRKSSIWGEVEVRRPLRKNSIDSTTGFGRPNRGGMRR